MFEEGEHARRGKARLGGKIALSLSHAFTPPGGCRQIPS